MSLLLNGANPTTTQLQQQEKVYSDYISACVASENCTSFVTWGFTDHVSWIPKHFPGFGSAHIWDKNYNPKPHIYPKLLESLE
ncbi:MAG: endo-1,4-beta-xylanase [Bdellovibrionaceae bacterium]|nr:endo-1,4-beta-xylanase [Pseudobdellovibrionaceae bacterium]